ncbi:MAG: 7-cyano-7-deazaguanine synthase QueC [Nanoarchaeota archaeon]
MEINKEILNQFKGKKAVVILSGGLDSTTLLHFLAKVLKIKIYPLIFDYGQKHKIEIDYALEQVKELQKNFKVYKPMVFKLELDKLIKGFSALTDKEIKVPSFEELNKEKPITYVPYRNLVMISIALSYAEAKNCDFVFYGAQRHEGYTYWDVSKEFLKRLNQLSSLSDRKIKVLAPFIDLFKKEEILIGKELNIDYSKTWTCYRGPNKEGKACGECPSCKERIENFAKIGLIDPIQYEKEINWNELIKKLKENLNISEIIKKVEKELKEQLVI